MISHKSLAFSALLLSVAISSATAVVDQSCIEVTLPNILHLGQCLSLPQDLCSDRGSVVDVVGNLLSCAVQGISHLDIGSQLFLLQGIITEVLNRLGLGALVKTLFGLCRTVGGLLGTVSSTFLGGIFAPITNIATSVLPLGDCSGLTIAGEIMCDQPVVLKLPSALNVGKCLGTTADVCVGTHPNQAQVIQQLFNTLTCVVVSVLTNSPVDSVKGLLCLVAKVVTEILNAGPLSVVGGIVSQLEAAVGIITC